MRTTTKKSIAAFALVCMLVLALATAVVCGGGSLLAARADETTPPVEETPAGITATHVQDNVDNADRVKIFVRFSEAPTTENVENLQEHDEYKDKITVNGKNIGEFSDYTLSFLKNEETAALKFFKKTTGGGNNKLTFPNDYFLVMEIKKTDLDWNMPTKEDSTKTTWISEIVIKEGFPMWGDGAPSAEKTLSKDAYIEAGQNEFYLGVRKYVDTAAEGKISRVHYENGPEDLNKHEITIELQTQDGETGYIFDETNNLNHMLRRSKTTVNNNYGGKDANNNHIDWLDAATLYVDDADFAAARKLVNQNTVFSMISQIGLRYSVGKLITINDLPLADWMTLPLKAAYEAGFTTDTDIYKFATELGDFDGRNDVHIQGNKIKIYLNKTNSFVYNYTDENKQPATKTISWELPDLSESLNVKILPGFAGKLIKLTDGDELTLNTKNGEYDSAREEMEFEEIKLLGIDAPTLEDTNLIFRLQFDKDPSDGNRAYFTAQNNFIKNTELGQSFYTAEEYQKFSENGLFDIARNSIILGGEFGDSNEFRQMSIAQMMAESNLGIIENPNAAVLHLVKGDNRIAIGGFRKDEIVNVLDEEGNPVLDEEGNPLTEKREVNWPFRVKNLKQNFTLTIKAGFRTPAGYELKEDANFIYDYESVKWYKGTSVDDIKAERVRPVIEAIDALPAVDSLTLDDEYDVNDARDFYEELDDELKALVTNLDKLTAAEKKIAELKAGGGTDKPDDGDNSGDNNNTTEEGKKKGCKSSVGAVSVAGAMLMLTAAGVLSLSRKRGKKAE
ncbi:MAG: hypothetical protein HFE35_01040 [Clostridia bacterium]|nr:hypothetical protein [Clostridia bacterium]